MPTLATFAWNMLLKGGDPVISDLKNSGFNVVLAWSVHLNSAGDLIYNDPPAFVSGRKYVGDPLWPERLAELKNGGSVKKLRFSVGSGPPPIDFSIIQQLIAEHGVGPGSILHDNFKALKEAIPVIDGIDLDNEDNFDQATVVSFSRMLNELGYEVTFCPFSDQDFWVDCLHELNLQTPGLVQAFHVQCYSGGEFNRDNLQTWIDAIAQKMGPDFDAAGFVLPGLWCRHRPDCSEGDCPDTLAAQFAKWKEMGIRGGFLWQYDDLQRCKTTGGCSGSADTAAYATAMRQGLGGTEGTSAY